MNSDVTVGIPFTYIPSLNNKMVIKSMMDKVTKNSERLINREWRFNIEKVINKQIRSMNKITK